MEGKKRGDIRHTGPCTVQELSSVSGKGQTEQLFSAFCPGHVP